MTNIVYMILILVVIQRVSELFLSRRNTKRLLTEGAVEFFPEHYPIIVALHTTWLLALFYCVTPSTPIHVGLFVAYVILQFARYHVIRTLGPNWTTRVLRLPGQPLVRHGIYKYIKHPNYLIVAIEIFLLPLVFDMKILSLAFGVLNLIVLTIRIHFENRALKT